MSSFTVLIGLKEDGHAETLVDACRMFIEKTKKIVQEGTSAFFLYEACMLEAEFNGIPYMMNFNAICKFAHAVGLLKQDGTFADEPAHVSPELEREIFIYSHQESFEVWLAEQWRAHGKEAFRIPAAAAIRIALAQMSDESETESQLLLLEHKIETS